MSSWTQRFKKSAFLFLLGTVLIALTAVAAKWYGYRSSRDERDGSWPGTL
jgi:hypothetical protein